MGTSSLKQIENRIVDWAMTLPSIRAVIICGSTERRINPGDEWADLDFEIYVTDYAEFITKPIWLERFGSVWIYLQLQEDDNPIFLALYNDADKVDFHFFKVEELKRLIEFQELHDSYTRGYRIVIDKDQLAQKLPPITLTPTLSKKPSQDEFSSQVNVFWYGAIYVAKQIRRRNLWVVKYRDWTMKQSLLKMLEWHTQALHQWQYDTWHDGHFMYQWVDSQIWKEIHCTFGEYDSASSWRALLATLDLFRKLAIETAQYLGYKYSTDLDNKITEYLKSLYQTDEL